MMEEFQSFCLHHWSNAAQQLVTREQSAWVLNQVHLTIMTKDITLLTQLIY